MAGGDIVLQFVWPPIEARADIRTLRIKQIDENGQAQDIYKAQILFQVSLHITLTRASFLLHSFTIRRLWAQKQE